MCIPLRCVCEYCNKIGIEYFVQQWNVIDIIWIVLLSDLSPLICCHYSYVYCKKRDGVKTKTIFYVFDEKKKIYSEILICTCLVLFERIVNNQLCSGTFSTLIADPRRLIGIFIVFERYFEVRIIIVNCLKPLLLLFGTCFISNHSQKWRLFGFVCSSNWMFAIFQVCQLWTWCQSLFLETFFWM